MCIQTQQSETMQIQQHTIQCVSDVDEAERIDDVIDETQRLDVDEIDETHKTDVLQRHQLVQADSIDEIELNEILAQEIDENVEVDDDDDDDTRETDEIDELDTDEVLLIIIQWTDEIDETDETDEFDESDENDEIIEVDMLLEHREIDETDTSVETLDIEVDDVIVCRADMLEADESESFNDESEATNDVHSINDDNDETQSIICIDSDCMLAKYTTTESVQNDEFDELDDVLQCRLHTQDDDEIDEIEQIDEKCSFDISEALFVELLMWVDENDELDEVLVEVATIDVRELLELLDVVWFAKLCNFIQ